MFRFIAAILIWIFIDIKSDQQDFLYVFERSLTLTNAAFYLIKTYSKNRNITVIIII